MQRIFTNALFGAFLSITMTFVNFNATAQSTVTRTNLRVGSPTEDEFGFSAAVKVSNSVYVSGLTGFDPEIKGFAKGDAYRQTVVAFQKLDKMLQWAGGTRNDIVKTRLFVADADKFDSFARAHREYFTDHERPTALLVEVAKMFHPDMEVLLEVDVTIADEKTVRTSYSSGQSWEEQYGFNRTVATRQGGAKTVSVSGTTGWDAEGKMVEGLYRQTQQSLLNVKTWLEKSGASINDLVHVRIYSPEITSAELRQAYTDFFSSAAPPTSFVAVQQLPYKSMNVEVEATAVSGSDGSAGQRVVVAAISANSEKAGSSFYDQTVSALKNLETVLLARGASLNEVVKTRVYTSDMAGFKEIARAHKEFFDAVRPASIVIHTGGAGTNTSVQIEAEAIIGSAIH